MFTLPLSFNLHPKEITSVATYTINTIKIKINVEKFYIQRLYFNLSEAVDFLSSLQNNILGVQVWSHRNAL